MLRPEEDALTTPAISRLRDVCERAKNPARRRGGRQFQEITASRQNRVDAHEYTETETSCTRLAKVQGIGPPPNPHRIS